MYVTLVFSLNYKSIVHFECNHVLSFLKAFLYKIFKFYIQFFFAVQELITKICLRFWLNNFEICLLTTFILVIHVLKST